jgi:uncharacterized protein (TIGR00730 family)
MKRICVYCGSSPGLEPEYQFAAKALAAALVDRNLSLVYGGASVGLMGAIANEMLRLGGHVIGVIPEALMTKEVGHHSLSELIVVPTMHERKAKMAELSDGFIALPGGIGTFEELFEILTWAQLGFHQKPVGILNVLKFYDQMLAFLDHAQAAGFLKPIHRQLLLQSDQASDLLNLFANYQSQITTKWWSA